jgi:hypothetical protein
MKTEQPKQLKRFFNRNQIIAEMDKNAKRAEVFQKQGDAHTKTADAYRDGGINGDDIKRERDEAARCYKMAKTYSEGKMDTLKKALAEIDTPPLFQGLEYTTVKR